VDEKGVINIPHSTWQFIGDPSPEIDLAWESLISGMYLRSLKSALCTEEWIGRYFAITKDEAISIYGDRYEELWNAEVGGYTAGQAPRSVLLCFSG
jgi:hypothetical protein